MYLRWLLRDSEEKGLSVDVVLWWNRAEFLVMCFGRLSRESDSERESVRGSLLCGVIYRFAGRCFVAVRVCGRAVLVMQS